MRAIRFFLASFLLAHAASAQELIAQHEDWRVLRMTRDGKTVCYLASLPIKETGTYKKRGEPYLLVTHKSGPVDEVSVSSGYPYKEGSEVALAFGNTRFALFTKGELAWAYDEATDKNIVKAMIRNNNLTIKGTSWKGTHSTDTYSLKGFTAAHREMKRTCE